MSKRVEAFANMERHPWLKKSWARLSAAEIALANSFIATNDSLDLGEFEKAVNRMFMDKPKPKNWTVICELLSCSNSRA